jgi:hypothetical protein
MPDRTSPNKATSEIAPESPASAAPAASAPKPRPSRAAASRVDEPAFLVFDIETVPDGELIRRVRFAGEAISPDEAVERFRREMLERSGGRSDFIPASYHHPVAVSVMRVNDRFVPTAIKCLDAPKFRPREIIADWWRGLGMHQSVLVSFNGRVFDLPVLELGAFRYGISARGHFTERFGRRWRYATNHIDLLEWLSNHGAAPVAGGLNLLSKLLGKPGKIGVRGADVLDLHRAGQVREINDYCMTDVLDTYFVFLRTRVMTGELTLETEQACVEEARGWIEKQSKQQPALRSYLDNWGDWKPWV